MVFKRAALAGITALAFGQFAIANESAQQQSQGGMQNEQSSSRQEQAQGQQPSQDTIKQAQQQLSSKGHDVQADGVLGPKTQAAVKEFQQAEGIQPSGQLDTQTLAALGVQEGSAGMGSSSDPASSPRSGSSSTSGS